MRSLITRKIVPLIPLLTGCLLVGGCHREIAENPEGHSRTLPTIQAEVIQIEPRSWPRMVRVQGSLIADEVAAVGAKVAGRVAEVHCDLGDPVAAGEPLVTIDQEEFELQVSQAAAELAQARAAVGLREGEPVESLKPENSPPVLEQKATWNEARTRNERTRQLYRQNAITDADLDAAIAAEEVAAARYDAALNSVKEKIALIGVRQVQLDLARQRLEDTQVRAPFDGLVQERHIASGSYVQVGQTLVTLVRTHPLRFQATLPERYTPLLSIGQKVVLRVQSHPDVRHVTVSRISPSLDPLSRSLTFEAEIANPDRELRNGLFCEADLILDPDAQAIAVPESAIVEFAGTEKVWKVVEGKTVEQPVVTGDRREGFVAILQGLAEGDMIFLDGTEGEVAHVEPIVVNAIQSTQNQDLDHTRVVAQ